MKLLYTLFSVFFWGFVGISSALFFPISLIIKSLTFLFDKNLKVLHMYTSLWASLYTWINPLWNVKIIGREKIDRRKTYIITANHFSVTDIFSLFRLLIHFKWVSKAEIFKIPLIGWNMSLNSYIKLNRGSNKGNAIMMKDSEKTLNSGSSIIIFPEGTRSTTNEVRDFKNGAFELAKRTKKPILPIVIEGSQNALPKKGVMLKGVHHITIKVLDEISSETYESMSVEELAQFTRKKITDELVEIRKQK